MNSEQMGLLSVIMSKDLDRVFTNRLWGSSIHVGRIEWKDNNISVIDYDFIVRLICKFDEDYINQIKRYIEDNYGFINGKLKILEGYVSLVYKGIKEEDLLNVDTLFKMRRI